MLTRGTPRVSVRTCTQGYPRCSPARLAVFSLDLPLAPLTRGGLAGLGSIPGHGQFGVEHLVEELGSFAGSPDVHLGKLMRGEPELDVAIALELGAHVGDLLGVAAVEPAGDAEHGGHLLDASLVACGELAEVGVFLLGIGAAMVAGDVGDQFELARLESLPGGCARIRW